MCVNISQAGRVYTWSPLTLYGRCLPLPLTLTHRVVPPLASTNHISCCCSCRLARSWWCCCCCCLLPAAGFITLHRKPFFFFFPFLFSIPVQPTLSPPTPHMSNYNYSYVIKVIVTLHGIHDYHWSPHAHWPFALQYIIIGDTGKTGTEIPGLWAQPLFLLFTPLSFSRRWQGKVCQVI